MEFREPAQHIELKKTEFGIKPVISGRRITVLNVGIMHVQNETSIDWIAENYDLTHAQIHAALAYFYDNREAFEEKLREAQELLEQIGTPLSDFLNIEDESSPVTDHSSD